MALNRGPKEPQKHEDPTLLVLRPKEEGILEIIICRIPLFIWSFGPLLFPSDGKRQRELELKPS